MLRFATTRVNVSSTSTIRFCTAPFFFIFSVPVNLSSMLPFHHQQQQKHRPHSETRSSSSWTPDEKRQLFSEKELRQAMSNLSDISKHPEFRSMSRRGGRNRKEGPAAGAAEKGGRHTRERNLFDWRHTFGSEVTRLTHPHFEAMTVPEMLMLLQLATALSPVSGSSHVASGVSAALLRRLKELSSSAAGGKLSPAVETVVRLLRLRKSAAGRRGAGSGAMEAGMNERTLSLCVTVLMERLLVHFQAQNEMRRHHDEAMSKRSNRDDETLAKESDGAVSFYDDSALLRRVLLGFVSCFNDRSCSQLFDERLLQDLVHHLLFCTAAMAKMQAQKHTPDSAPPSHTPVIAVLAMTLCRLRMFDESVVGFFKWAAPICIADADLLSGPQLSYIMEAFANVGYHHPGLFLTLGQKAGELGELLREEEVARVISAMSKTDIEHSKLRASLESSMRMKTIHKRTSHSTTLF